VSTDPLDRALSELGAFGRTPELQHLREASHSLAAVDLLQPQPAQQRLARRGRTLALWLDLLAQLDGFSAALAQPAPGDPRSQVERNRLAWQADALDQQATQQVQQFVQQYYTPAPVDQAELTAALQQAALGESRLRQLLP
jgi:hypothetical protein